MYEPPFTMTTTIITLVEEIGEAVGAFVATQDTAKPLLRRKNRIKTVQGTCAIEGNSLQEAQVTALLDGKRVIGAPQEILEIQNALVLYDQLSLLKSTSLDDMLRAHEFLMKGLVLDAGQFRTGGAGVQKGDDIIHLAPPASQVAPLVSDLFKWLKESEDHPLIKSSIFHYEFEFIHPFSDGNGRIGRFWQTLILQEWRQFFSMIPMESLIKERQDAYYHALNESTSGGSSTPFVTFMLQVIRDSLQNSPDSSSEESELSSLCDILQSGPLSLSEIALALKLKDRKNIMARWISPALASGLIERTIPEKPKSPKQKYRLV